MTTQQHKSPKTIALHMALIDWLCEEYPIEEATRQILEAKILEDDGIITIEYSTGAKDVVKITENGVEKILPKACKPMTPQAHFIKWASSLNIGGELKH